MRSKKYVSCKVKVTEGEAMYVGGDGENKGYRYFMLRGGYRTVDKVLKALQAQSDEGRQVDVGEWPVYIKRYAEREIEYRMPLEEFLKSAEVNGWVGESGNE